MQAHGIQPRQPRPDALKSKANDDPGLFGYMFPSLKPLVADDQALNALAAAMIDPVDQNNNVDPARADNPDMPAGFTYFGQFIDHDITLDLTSIGEKQDDPEAQENFRSPALDLDSVYGLGPDGSQFMYERDAATLKMLPSLIIGNAPASDNPTGQSGPIPDVPGGDLPRSTVTGIAIIGDSRNDENLLVAQMHLAFMHFHNKVVAHLRDVDKVPEHELFKRARDEVVWHYQWLVLHEFLETITGEKGIADRILHAGRRFYRFKRWPFIPMEFSAAAYRWGHSAVREVYSHNRVFNTDGGFPATLKLLFRFSGKSGELVGSLQDPAIPLPQPVLPSNWVIDWRRFFDFKTKGANPNFRLNLAHRIDPLLTPELHSLPGGASLASLNLRRGVQKKLPSGQDVARAMNITPLTSAELSTGPDGVVAKAHGFDKKTPLWYYILKEAEVKAQGLHLGPVGKTIVAEVLIGIVQGSKGSYLQTSPFKPRFGKVPGVFTMVDLITFAGVVNPIGD
ncbi:MAG: heme peroxidase family protein [Phreatobacter sp.]|uniref:peroxidase family protein n=1 Tax=Phreatobacter sp. TaxID=1966341 RepID=UPI002734AEDA|nr:heme peroxidase family protein [Phreatobacter sp.]MDP2803962.1 heme peroxidase family protein [Phreatobacter sp.]